VEKANFTVVEHCLACRSCEIACAVEHSRSRTLAGALAETPRPRQRVRVEGAGAFSYPVRCMHCEEAACIAACPTGAMTRHPRTNAVYVDAGRCIGCWMCVMVCPFGAVGADPVARKALKCDRCPERVERGLPPACVAACPTRAMIFATPEEMAARQRQAAARSAAGAVTARAASTVEAWRTLGEGMR